MSLDINKILVPTDFSKASLAALDHAAFIAKNTNAAVVLLHVIKTNDYDSILDNKKKKGDEASDLERKIKAKLDEILKDHPKLKGFKKSSLILKGKTYREILNAIDTEEADLVIMGKHGMSVQGEKSRFIIGSNTQKVLEGAPLPVITVRSSEKVECDNILLPLDVTKQTTKKVNTAIAWAKAFGSKVHIVTVSSFLDDFVSDVTTLKKNLKLVADEVAKNGVKCTTKVIKFKSVPESVLDYGKVAKADMTIIMKSEEINDKSFGLSSRGRKVVAGSLVPVMSINPPRK